MHHKEGKQLQISSYVLQAYALLLLVGGVIGFFKGNSIPSLITGFVSGALLLIASRQKERGLYTAFCVTGSLLIFFGYRWVTKGTFMPSGMMTILSTLVFGQLVNTFRLTHTPH